MRLSLLSSLTLCYSVQSTSGQTRGQRGRQGHPEGRKRVSVIHFLTEQDWKCVVFVQPTHSRRRHQPNRHHLPSPCPERRGSYTLYFCIVEGGTRARQLDEAANKLRDDMSRPEKKREAQGRGDRGDRRLPRAL